MGCLRETGEEVVQAEVLVGETEEEALEEEGPVLVLVADPSNQLNQVIVFF